MEQLDRQAAAKREEMARQVGLHADCMLIAC
jgi:hypothetical protein